MKQVLQHPRARTLEVAEVSPPSLRAGGILVRNVASLISAGTERMVVDFANKSMVGKALDNPALVRKVLDKARREGIPNTMRAVLARLDEPIALGYSCAGVIIDVASEVTELKVGDRVACAGMGHASHAEIVFVPRRLAVAIPDGVSFDDASYVTVGAIALHGVRVSGAALGESVAVIGLGLIGMLTVQILAASGCRVYGIDLDPGKVDLARGLGAEAAAVRADAEEGANVFTGGIGCDAVIITAASNTSDPVNLAAKIARHRAAVTVVGAVSIDVPRNAYYEKELAVRVSRSYGPGRYDPEYEERGHDYPISYVRWTEQRNMSEFLRLVARGAVTPARLTTHRIPIAEAEHAYDLLRTQQVPLTGIVLTYPETDRKQPTTVTTGARSRSADGIGIGVIGAGSFGRSVLLPTLARSKKVRLLAVATTTGTTSLTAARKFGFERATTDLNEILVDPLVEAVFVLTRHGSHAAIAASALAAGKAVFVEKPLALTLAQLQAVLDAQRSTGAPLFVGFNRRYSPLAVDAREFMSSSRPLAITYRVNAGAVPRESWIHDPEVGGGRVIGEMCHFLDLLAFFTGEPITEVFAYGVGGPEADLHDTLAVTVKHDGGSVGTIAYYSTGDRALSKERVELFGGGRAAVIDDFRALETAVHGHHRRRRRMAQSKGYAEELGAFLESVRSGGTPQPLYSLAATTRATFAIEQSLRTGVPVSIDAA